MGVRGVRRNPNASSNRDPRPTPIYYARRMKFVVCASKSCPDPYHYSQLHNISSNPLHTSKIRTSHTQTMCNKSRFQLVTSIIGRHMRRIDDLRACVCKTDGTVAEESQEYGHADACVFSSGLNYSRNDLMLSISHVVVVRRAFFLGLVAWSEVGDICICKAYGRSNRAPTAF